MKYHCKNRSKAGGDGKGWFGQWKWLLVRFRISFIMDTDCGLGLVLSVKSALDRDF